MSEYIGSVGSKISVEVTYKKRCKYTTHYTFYGETHNIFILEDAEGNCIVWNTSNWLEDKKFVDDFGSRKMIWEGSKLLLNATVKEHSEYNGTKQTVISRPRFTLLELAKSPDEIQAEREAEKELKKQEQLASLTEADYVWEMPYKQYKEHYADCETIIDSYNSHTDSQGYSLGASTIKVIIREGRLKNSGVRGEHFHRYSFKDENGKVITSPYRAVSEENARKRLAKDFPNSNTKKWELTFYR